ncbi:MAG: hypothetical protein ACJ8GN_04595 [Longimicrobiaceae bacterium]
MPGQEHSDAALREEFDDYFREEGGVASPEFMESFPRGTLVAMVREFAQQEARDISAGLASRGVDHTVYFDVVRAPDMNAQAAMVRPGVSFIGINLGTLLRLFPLLEILIAQAHQPDERVADADTLRRVLRHRAPPDEQWEFLREVTGRSFLGTQENLATLVMFQWVFAAEFTYGHEINHAMLGHAEYAARELQLERLSEGEHPGGEPEEAQFRLLELRADYAGGRMLGCRIPNKRFLFFPLPFEEFTVVERMANAAFALTALMTGFNISWGLDPTGKLWDVHGHPHPDFRFRMASDGVMSGLRTFPDGGHADTWLHTAVHPGNGHCKAAFRRILGSSVEMALQPGPVFYLPHEGQLGPHPHLFSTDAETMYLRLARAALALDQQTRVTAFLE